VFSTLALSRAWQKIPPRHGSGASRSSCCPIRPRFCETRSPSGRGA
jgi:hypothetical protein